MITREAAAQFPSQLDVRELRKPDKHPTIFAAYAALPVGESFVLINDHDPKHLHDEFESDHPGSYLWEYLITEPRDWRIKITKLASTPLPRICNTADAVADPGQPDATGAVWRLQTRERDLDSNLIALAPGGTIDAHAGPDLDVLVHVLAGSGHLTTERDTVDLRPGAWCGYPADPGGSSPPDPTVFATSPFTSAAKPSSSTPAGPGPRHRPFGRLRSADAPGSRRAGSAEPSRMTTVELVGDRPKHASRRRPALIRPGQGLLG